MTKSLNVDINVCGLKNEDEWDKIVDAIKSDKRFDGSVLPELLQKDYIDNDPSEPDKICVLYHSEDEVTMSTKHQDYANDLADIIWKTTKRFVPIILGFQEGESPEDAEDQPKNEFSFEMKDYKKW